MNENLSVAQTIQKLHDSLKEYIEATYHISDEVLVKQREKLLLSEGVIFREPFIESTPKYKTGKVISDLDIDEKAKKLLKLISIENKGNNKLIYDPLYEHQTKSLELSLNKGKSLLIMTGTGSGKTECFLLPVLGKLAIEASDPKSFKKKAVRTILLYPMNALVNDQLGRLRNMFGDQRIVQAFKESSNRPVTFARYTSRTLYPGVRSAKRDQIKLTPIKNFYVDLYNKSIDATDTFKQKEAIEFIIQLKNKGKWPAKENIATWYGNEGTRWYDEKTKEYKRCITMPNDSELLTRHEVLHNPPDILLTNYSMLEYMLMRPIEVPIFESTKKWLHENPKEKLFIIIDEAHLYRGAAGTEVAYLLRRLTNRLEVTEDRIQYICTSASFTDKEKAKSFASQLTGKLVKDIEVIEGSLYEKTNQEIGNSHDVELLSSMNLSRLYDETIESKKFEIIKPFIEYRNINEFEKLNSSLFEALKEYPPLNLLINVTMKEAISVNKLANIIFPGCDKITSHKALTSLIALGSMARQEEFKPSLLPCRVHSLHRGLPGLWVCLNNSCSQLSENENGGFTGKLYSQPREHCECGSKVFELFTCRNCGAAYIRAYTNDIQNPMYLWSESGSKLKTTTGEIKPIFPIDVLLENPTSRDRVEMIELDIITGRVNPNKLGDKTRRVYITNTEINNANTERVENEERIFRTCGVCEKSGPYGQSLVQDHQTKGDQPFLALISKQIQSQPPNSNFNDNDSFAPLRGRKVLIFSDSRQSAARLAPVLQRDSMKDALRPLLVYGFRKLNEQIDIKNHINLDDSFLAILIGAFDLRVPLRPALIEGEEFTMKSDVFRLLEEKVDFMTILLESRAHEIPKELILSMYEVLIDRYYGLQSLALASIKEAPVTLRNFSKIPDIRDVINYFTSKESMIRFWLNCFIKSVGIRFNKMQHSLINDKVKTHNGNFPAVKKIISDKKLYKEFNNKILPKLLEIFTQRKSDGEYFLSSDKLTLDLLNEWSYCKNCKTVQRAYLKNNICIKCYRASVLSVDFDNDSVFKARKNYYRSGTINVLKDPPEKPFSFIAAEHTAQLNTATAKDIFSIAEKYELLFQDVNISLDDASYAIDVLSCTTTMEVGIDIGALSGVALRNMPPSRSSYQQRAGRAGRRGNAIATVTSFASSDSHDEYYFNNATLLISGAVTDPTLVLDNDDIALRHILAYLIQKYHRTKLTPEDIVNSPSLFDVLGTVEDFNDQKKKLNKFDFFDWMDRNENEINRELNNWLPTEISEKTRRELLSTFVKKIKEKINYAVSNLKNSIHNSSQFITTASDVDTEEQTGIELNDTNSDSNDLLGRLLYKGVLPKYAFPTDVVSFYVFKENNSYFPEYSYSPSYSLSMALSQIAPGKTIWIDNKKYYSGAIYSPFKEERSNKWNGKKLYYECSICHFAETKDISQGRVGEVIECKACGNNNTFGPAKHWFSPSGFANPVDKKSITVSDEQIPISYATRAKLVAPSPINWLNESKITEKIFTHYERHLLLVTNTGPKEKGYKYCVTCGRIEPEFIFDSSLVGNHLKPYPDSSEQNCINSKIARKVSLGTDFVSDILMILFKLEEPLKLVPGTITTDIALRTLSEAITKAASQLLELESGELQAEYRPALTPLGPLGKEVEIYMYDTLSGGAGFSRRASELKQKLFHKALEVLENCSSNCDNSCYRCLRSFKNKFEHDLLDRNLGGDLLKYLLYGEIPFLNETRMKYVSNLLYYDLMRVTDFKIEKEKKIDIDGIGITIAPLYIETNKLKYIIDFHNPLTPGAFSNANIWKIQNFTLNEYQVIHPFDEIVVKKNLPYVTSTIVKQIEG